MSEYETVTDIMKANARILTQKRGIPVDKIESRKRMSPNYKYNFCPHCFLRVEKAGQDYKTVLQPMWIVYHKLLVVHGDGIGIPVLENHYECDVCRQEITEEDYLNCRPKRYNQGAIDLKKVDINDPNFILNF